MTTHPDEPLSEARFRALRASIEQPHLNGRGLEDQQIHRMAYLHYLRMRRSDGYREWLGRCASKFWCDRYELILLALDQCIEMNLPINRILTFKKREAQDEQRPGE
jgi:hypothetical protein